MFCIPIPISALTPFIFGKSRMRKRARTDLCGSAVAITTAIAIENAALLVRQYLNIG